MEAYNYWKIFAKENNLKPVFKNMSNNASPWCFPAYAENNEIANYWYEWGWKNQKNVFPWPTLPEKIIKLNGKAFNRWKKIICFGID